MNALFITLKLETPLLITGLGSGEENSSKSLPYIPGSALRGALISRFKADTQDLPLDPKAGRLFFSGAVRFLNAYPLDENGARMLPIPASWRKEKGRELKDAHIADYAIASNEEMTKPIGKFYKDNSGSAMYAFSPEEEIAIHIASQGRGVVKAGQSTVFQYQSLARAQKFGALILAETSGDLVEIEKLLEPNMLYLGRSRSAGYGKVRIEAFEKTEKAETASEKLNDVTITLLSDTILRDEHGQPTHDLDGYLTNRLDKAVKNKKAFICQTDIGGFNRKWKLPLPQTPALGMGSVFVYPAGQLAPSDLDLLVQSGIGERRVDGFGRIAVNWHGMAQQKFVEDPETQNDRSETSPLSPASQKLAAAMAERLLRHMLEQNLVAEVNRYTFKGSLTNHQLARMRTILRKALDENKPVKDVVPAFFASLKETAKNQWHNTRLYEGNRTTGTRLDMWMDERAHEQDGLEILQFGKQTDFPQVAGHTKNHDQTLKGEFTLRLMEAVIDRAMKLNKEA
jgi:CRISPR-associated protein Csx10